MNEIHQYYSIWDLDIEYSQSTHLDQVRSTIIACQPNLEATDCLRPGASERWTTSSYPCLVSMPRIHASYPCLVSMLRIHALGNHHCPISKRRPWHLLHHTECCLYELYLASQLYLYMNGRYCCDVFRARIWYNLGMDKTVWVDRSGSMGGNISRVLMWMSFQYMS